jgi:hypothetical protein
MVGLEVSGEEPMQLLEIGSCVANFVGAFILAIDAFGARSNNRMKGTARLLEERIHKLVNEKQPAAGHAGPTEQLEEALAERTRSLTIIGFCILTVGFLMDLIVKLRC